MHNNSKVLQFSPRAVEKLKITASESKRSTSKVTEMPTRIFWRTERVISERRAA